MVKLFRVLFVSMIILFSTVDCRSTNREYTVELQDTLIHPSAWDRAIEKVTKRREEEKKAGENLDPYMTWELNAMELKEELSDTLK